jgi:hypothetical protein
MGGCLRQPLLKFSRTLFQEASQLWYHGIFTGQQPLTNLYSVGRWGGLDDSEIQTIEEITIMAK